MSFLNQIHVIGNITADPAFALTQAGNSVCNFTVATNEFWVDKQGTKQQESEFHLITVWGKTAEFVNKYCYKGTKVFVEGRKQTKEYDTRTKGGEDVTKYRCEIIASKVLKLEKKEENE